MAKKNILIIGGTGFIGRHLVKKLVNRNFYKIHCVSRTVAKKKIKNVKYIQLNKKKKLDYKKISKFSYTYVVNVAGYINHKNSGEEHIVGLKNLINFFRNRAVKRFVQIGSSTEYGFQKAPQKEFTYHKEDLKSQYAINKFLATKASLKAWSEKKFPIVIARPFIVYGPGQKLDRLIPSAINAFLKNKNLDCSSGMQVRDFVYIDDVLGLLIKMIFSKEKINGKIFNIGSGKPTTVKKIINEISTQCKGGVPIFNKLSIRKDEPKKLYADLTNSKIFFGWKPKINIKDGIAKTINFYKKK